MEELVTHGATPMNGAVAAKTCRVPVTGANGFIGSVVAPLLAERGFDVHDEA
jgi:nucleoside-diphosphate-sugar epimerase